MLTNQTIRKLADYVLLNAYSVNSTGFYNGKAGMSLCLFEVARYLNDEHLEEHAFELLQESLLSKNEDISFEDGLSGIGYVLQYLIDEEFIDADFDEFFGEQTSQILAGLEKRKEEPMSLLNSLNMIQFLSAINQSKNNPAIAGYIKTLYEAAELFLSMQFHDFTSMHYRGDKTAVLALFEDYLRMVNISAYPHFSSSLIESYVDLYRKGKIASSYSVGCYLEKLSNPDYMDIAGEHKQNALKCLKPDLQPLRVQLEVMQLLKQDDNGGKSLFDRWYKQLSEQQNSEVEQHVLRSIPEKVWLPGYGHGIARFLSFIVRDINKYAAMN